MIAYNKEWLWNLYVRDQADEAAVKGAISFTEQEAITNASPVGFYTPNIWGRIGIAILTLLAISFSGGFLALLFKGFDSFAVAMISASLILYAILEIAVVGSMQHYNAGSDNLLIILSGFLFVSGIAAGLSGGANEHYTFIALCTTLVCSWLALRFVDSIMTVSAIICALNTLFLALEDMGLGKVTAPFVVMAAAFVIYKLAIAAAAEYRMVLYRTCLQAAAITALVMLYAAGNYFVVNELNTMLSHTRPDEPMPFAMLFWVWTIIMPFAYIVAGIRIKNSLLIRTGLMLTVAMVLTYRHYYALLSPDKAMILAGGILIATGYALIKYLATPKHGFTFEQNAYTSERYVLHNALSEQVISKVGDDGNKADGDRW